MRISRFALLAAAALAVCGCAARAPRPPEAKNTLILTASTALLADMLRNLTIGIPGVTVNAIVPLGSDPHEFEPTPTDAKLVAGSSAVFVIGAGYEEEWLGKLLRNAGGQRPVIEAGAGIELDGSGLAGGKDPHIWMDPQRWIQATMIVAKGIGALDPAIADAVMTNAAAYTVKLEELDALVTAEISELSPGRRVLVTSHDAFGYYARRYGFTLVGAVIPSASSVAAPSAKEVRALVDQVRAQGAKAIFTEAGINPKLTEAVATEAGIKVVEQLYVDTLSDAAGPAPTYIELMRHNTRTIVAALK